MVESVSQKTDSTQSYSGGKIAGGVVGAGVAGLCWNKSIKNGKAVDEFIASDALKTAVEEQSIDKIRAAIKDSKISKLSKKSFESNFNKMAEQGALTEFHKSFTEILEKSKKLRTPMSIALAATTVLLGVGIGSLFDKHKQKD